MRVLSIMRFPANLTAAVLFLCLFALCMGAGTLASTEIEYAEGFSVEERDGYTAVEVSRRWEEGNEASRYALISRSVKIEELDIPDGFRVIRTPVRSMIALSTTYLYPLVRLDTLDSLIAVDNHGYVYNKKVRRRIENDGIAEVGNGPTVDLERIVSLEPEMVMATGVAGEWNTAKRLEEAGVPVVVNADYLERAPLARAEWIKFIALFVKKEERAAELFEEIERRYASLKRSAASVEHRPTVFLNRPMQGRWVLPGGESYMARFLEDAGAEYVYSENEKRAALTMDTEAVYSEVVDAEFWLHQYGWNSLSDVIAHDPRLGRLEAFRKGNVLNNNARVNEGGGNDFYESGPYRPDLILKDLLSIFHPSHLPEHELYYYRYLK